MSRFQQIPDRAWEFAGDVGERIRQAVPPDVARRIRDAMPHDAGHRLMGALPSRAGGLLQTGVALGAAKTGTRVAGAFLRRHPVAVAATVAGAGLLWYAAKRKARQTEDAHLQGNTRPVTARSTLTGTRTAATEHRDGSPGDSVEVREYRNHI